MLNTVKYKTNAKKDKYFEKGKIKTIALIIMLIIYSIVILIPLYFLLIRSFVPTVLSTELHLWFPKIDGVKMNNLYGDFGTYYNMDSKKFKRAMGIKGYIAPYMTLMELSESYNIPEEKIIKYLSPYVKYNGWMIIFKNLRLIKSLLATIIITSCSIIVGGFLGLCTGSVIAGFRKRWHLLVYNIYMFEIIIPTIMIILQLYLIVGMKFNLADSYLALFIIYIKGGAISTMIFTTYYFSLPKELKDSVYSDGGNRLHYFWHIQLPLGKVPFASYACIHLPKYWNDLIIGRVFLSDAKLTLIPLIDQYQGNFDTNFQAIYSGLLISIIPILIVYILLRDLFIRSAFSGSVKG